MTNNVEFTEEKSYILRKLEAKDVFLMSKIVGAIGINEFKDCIQSDTVKSLLKGADASDSVGVMVFLEVAQVILNNIQRCEKDIYLFLANLSGMREKQIESMPMNTFFEMIIDVVQKEEFKDFIKVVSKLFK